MQDTAGSPVPGAEMWITGVNAGADAEPDDWAEAMPRAIELGQRARSGDGYTTGADGALESKWVATEIQIRVQVLGDQRREGASAPSPTASIEVFHRDGITVARC